MKLLLDFGADVAGIDKEGNAPLRLTATLNYADGCKVLLEYGADPNVGSGQWSNMAWACDGNKAEIIRLLLLYGCDPNARSPNGETNFQYAVRRDPTDMMQQMLTYNADVNRKNASGETPLGAALDSSKPKQAKVLLARGADPSLKGTKYPLAMASYRNLPEMVNMLLCSGRSFPAECWESAMKAAAPHAACLSSLITGGRNPTEYRGLLELAVAAGSEESAKILLDAGYPIDDSNANGGRGLVSAVQRGNIPLAKFLLGRGANPNTALEVVSQSQLVGNLAMLEILLAAGGDPTTTKRKGLLVEAVYRNSTIDTVKLLIDAGVSPDEKLSNVHTCLAVAARENKLEMVSYLLSHGADPNLDGDKLPIIWAAGKADVRILQALIDAGAEVNKKHQGNDFALLEACRQNHVENIKLLLKHGAKLDMINKNGESAVDIAAKGGHEDLMMMLLDGDLGSR